MLILAFAAGAGSVRVPAVGAALLALLLVVPSWKGIRLFLNRAAACVVVFAAGWAAMQCALAEVPDKPSWAAIPRRAVLVQGQISSATGLPGGRVRVILEGLRPVEQDRAEILLNDAARKAMKARLPDGTDGGKKAYAGAVFEDDAAALPGYAALTLDGRTLELCGRPLPGQTLTALLRLFPSGGSRNADDHAVSAYWAAREVWHNARLVRRSGLPLVLELNGGYGPMYQLAALRESWRSSLLAMFAGGAADEGAEGSIAGAPMPEAPAVQRADSGRAREASAREEVALFSQGRAIIAALLFGDRSSLSTRTVDLFTRAGLVHSLALSGQHLALAAMAGALCIFLLDRLWPSAFYHVPRRILLVWSGIPFALAYLFLGGAPFSLLRAALMMLVAAFYVKRRRYFSPLDALFAAAFLLVLGWPPALFELSVQLSVLAVAGILLALPLTAAFQHRFEARSGDILLLRFLKALTRWAGAMLIVSLSAQAAVLPLLAATFGAVSPCLWLNLLWLPPLTFITLPCAALGLLFLILLGPQSLSALLFTVAAWPADAMLGLLENLAVQGWLPLVQCFRPAPLSSLGWSVVLAALAFMAQRWLMARKRRAAEAAGRMIWKAAGSCDEGGTLRRLLYCGLFLMLAGQVPLWLDDVRARWEERVTLSLIDVAQGQAALLEYPGGRILVDGGGSLSPYFDCGRSIVAPALTQGRLPYLDAVFVSHADVDHARGLRWILEQFTVGALYWSPVSAARADRGEGQALRDIARRRGIPEKVLRRGDAVELASGLRLEVLAPDFAFGEHVPPEKKLSNNDASLVLRLACGGHGLALLCGDMLSPALRRLVESGQEMQADALVLPHHGAASSFQKRLYDAVRPAAALASTASFNHYGFPSRRVRDEMARRGIPLFSTSDQGTVCLRWKKSDGRYRLELPR